MTTYRVKAKIWLYSGPAAWHFLTVPLNISSAIKKKHGKNARGWGSIPVAVTLGRSSWKTSIFPDKSGVYFLPLKAAIRLKEGIAADDVVEFSLKI